MATNEKEQKKRRFGILYLLLILLVLVFVVLYLRNTMSQYTSSGAGTGSAQVAVWKVKFAGTDKVYNNTMNMTFTTVSNPNVVANKIAPGLSATGKGYVDLTGTETAVNVKVTISQADLDTALTAAGLDAAQKSALKFTISGVTATNASTLAPAVSTGTNTFSVALPGGAAMTANESLEVVVTLTWADDTNLGVSDTKVGQTITNLSLPVTVTVTQKQV